MTIVLSILGTAAYLWIGIFAARWLRRAEDHWMTRKYGFSGDRDLVDQALFGMIALMWPIMLIAASFILVGRFVLGGKRDNRKVKP